MDLINKTTVVAEIGRIIEEPAPSHDSQCSWEDGYYCGLCKAESIIDTLEEVKEVDLANEVCKWMKDNCDDAGYFNQLEFAKHFFELGLKTQKGE